MEPTNNWTIASEPVIREFGGYRTIGMSCISDNKNGEFPALWHYFIPRLSEIPSACDEGRGLCYGICRCVPGKTDGSFEYIAATSADKDAEIPQGMISVDIPKTIYIIFPVRNLSEIHQVWNYTHIWFDAHPEWGTHCSREGCDCAQYPGFELYPVDFCDDKPLYVYIPVYAK